MRQLFPQQFPEPLRELLRELLREPLRELLQDALPDPLPDGLPERMGETAGVNVRIRAIETEGSQMLREYLRLSIFVRPGDPPAADVVSRQEIARYVDGWGRRGDDAVAAIDAASGADLGAAWLRLWTPPDVGYGFVDAATPELGLAVRPQHRGRGIGTAMLHALLARAADRHPAVSLSVSADNPAVRLYERLGFRVVAVAGGSLTMVKPLR